MNIDTAIQGKKCLTMNKEEKDKGDVIRVGAFQFAKPVCYKSWSGQRNIYNLKT